MILKKRLLIPLWILALMMPLGMRAVAQSSNNQPEQTYTIGSNDLDVVRFIQLVAGATGRVMVIDPSVKGKIKIMTNNKSMTKDELYDLFRSVLPLYDYTVVEVGGVTKVIRLKDARTSPLADADDASGLDEIVTDVIPAENISAAKLLAALRPMVSTNGNVAHHDGSNSIIITDSKANIDRVRRVIQKVDKAAVPTTEVVELKYSEAETMVQTLTKLGAADKLAAGLSNSLQMVADKRNNAILLAGEDFQRERIKSLIRLLDKPQQQAGNVRVVYLEYADATKVAEVLTKVASNLDKLGPVGGGAAKSGGAAASATVEADEDTNALLITAEGDTLKSLLAVVERLDIRRAQVLVEAIIVELNVSDNEELGTEWLFVNESEGLLGAGPRGGNTAVGVANGILGEDAGFAAIGQGLSGLSGSTLGVAGSTGGEQFLALVQALDSSSKANILSTPSLMTMDNNEAEISIGQEVPFQTGSFSSPGNSGNVSSPFSTFSRESVGILLKITPQVNEGNKVLLSIEQEVSDVDSSTTPGGGVITNESKINTQILANDGEIVVLGGLIQESTDNISNKVPILGSIPLLGYFFKYQRTETRKKNLVVFLRAKIVRDDEVMNAATMEKYNDIRNIQLESRKKGLPLMSNKHIPVLPDISLDELRAEIHAAAKEVDAEQDAGEVQAP